MKLKKLASLALAGALTLGLLPALSAPALAADGDTSYTLTIPSTLNVSGSGWNDTAGISATGTLATGKKLTVTASSANSWALKQQDGSETVSYTMKETSDGAEKTAWEFTTLPGSATLGIDVADYSSKPAGTYRDTVTFTAAVENAVTAPTLAGVTLTDGTGVVIKYNCGGASTVYFKYVAASDTFVPDYASYDEACGSKYPGAHGGSIVDQNWNGGSANFYFRKNGNTAHLYGNDGINMEVFDIQLDFDNMTYTQSYKKSYKAASGSFLSIKIGDTTITESQMTAQ